ncbi:hydroxymethylbilane synthase [Pseudochelatococcus contaminans]|uniref:Porphobilinogen deaminase n=1 Tax=Pseudochelatococcus contaminans TaxID=1538103 RepID=A0A7W6EFJ5_9HYPH|nr:hydroxymethylbilane synthase [Pseudochelatococcus contaminans]
MYSKPSSKPSSKLPSTLSSGISSPEAPVPLVIGTRGSPLALAQARQVAWRLFEALNGGAQHAQTGEEAPEGIVIAAIKTTGDLILDRALSEAGGKGLFTRELDAALLDGRTHLAVHSAKDLPTELPDGLVIAGCLPREDVRDAFISLRASSLADLPAGAVVGTASLRRQAQVLRLRPDLRITLLRGNVGTRLRRIEAGEIDATLLAMAGLNRLGLTHKAAGPIPVEAMLPAIGQGAIAIVTRAEDDAVRALVSAIADRPTGIALEAERAFLRVLDGSCRTPIAGYARVDGDRIDFSGLLLSEDGRETVAVTRAGSAADARALGEDAGREVLARAGPGLLPHRAGGKD